MTNYRECKLLMNEVFPKQNSRLSTLKALNK